MATMEIVLHMIGDVSRGQEESLDLVIRQNVEGSALVFTETERLADDRNRGM